MVTVFTPAYNRAHLLPVLYASLKKQTSKNFEWVVVDDGSSDGTAELLEKWEKEKEVPLRFVRQENGGKHRAVNRGVSLAKGELFLIVDSDDHLEENAVETLIKWQKSLDGGGKWGGVAGLKVHADGSDLGTSFKGGFVDATSLEREKYNITGDKAEAFFTEVLRAFPFPEFEGEKFVTENTVWYAIAAAGYKLRWFNEPVIVCEYLEDGLTRNAEEVRRRNPLGYLYYFALCRRVQRGPRRKLAAVWHYYALATSLGWDKKRICRELHVSRFTLLIARVAKKLFGKRG